MREPVYNTNHPIFRQGGWGRQPRAAALSALTLYATLYISTAVQAVSGVARTPGADFVVPEAPEDRRAAGRLAGDMAEFEKFAGRARVSLDQGLQTVPVARAVASHRESPVLSEVAASSGEVSQLGSRNEELVAVEPDAEKRGLARPAGTHDGSSAMSAAKSALGNMQDFEKFAEQAEETVPSDTVPVVTSSSPIQSVEVHSKVSTDGDAPEDVAQQVPTNTAEEAPNNLDVDDAEKTAQSESRKAVDDLGDFEKAVTSSQVEEVHVTDTTAPQTSGQASDVGNGDGEGMTSKAWGLKELILANDVVSWLTPSRMGDKCDSDYERQQCGHLRCLPENNTCAYCRHSYQCHSPRYRCFNRHTQDECSEEQGCRCDHKALFPMVEADVEAMILAFFATALAASGGIGGGGLLVPLFVLVEDFEADLASPLSSATITGGAIVGYAIFCTRWHPLYPAVQRPLIDYETVLIILPALLTGTMIGTIFDKILPLWFIMSMLFALLGFTTVRTCQRGIQALESENEDTPMGYSNNDLVSDIASACDDEKDAPLLVEKVEGTRFPARTLTLIVAFWCFVGLIALLKGGGEGQPSILPFVECNNMAYWFLQVGCWAAMGVVFIFVRDQVLHHGEGGLDGDIVWTPMNSITLPMLCLPCGIAAGLLGVGGGMVVGPLLLEMGARHATVSATSTFTVLVTASSSAVQFVLMGKLPIFYALFFAMIGGMGTFVGQLAVERIIKRFNSTSIIVFGISAVIFFSTVAMGFTGMRAIVRIAETGGNMGLRNLCD